jgi:hypothetical protein
MSRKKVLLTVATYPLPSRSYDELVCTAGVLEDGSWIRIYPFPLSKLIELRKNGKLQRIKYNWIELELEPRADDFRPESHSPKYYDFRDFESHGRLDTKSNWYERKKYCLKRVYTNLTELIEDSNESNNVSLATFKPTKIKNFKIEKEEREWKEVWKGLRQQMDLFQEKPQSNIDQIIPKVPYKFKYEFEDDEGRSSIMMIEDWEIGALYWKCLRRADGNEQIAIQKVKEQYFDNFTKTKDIYLFLGTTLKYHQRRMSNPFTIIGVFYPKKEVQQSLFSL